MANNPQQAQLGERGEREEDMHVEEGEDGSLQDKEPDQGTVDRACRWAGALSLVGLEFFLKEPTELEPKRILLKRLNMDGKSYQAKDVVRDRRLERSVKPGELTVGLASRKWDDPVVQVLRKAKVNPRPFMEPRAERPRSAVGEFLTPESGIRTAQRGRSESPFLRGSIRMEQRQSQGWQPSRGVPAAEGNREFQGVTIVLG
jgi:hypothetical protein